MNKFTIGQEIFVIVDDDHIERRTICDIHPNVWGNLDHGIYILYAYQSLEMPKNALIQSNPSKMHTTKESALKALIEIYEDKLKQLKELL